MMKSFETRLLLERKKHFIESLCPLDVLPHLDGCLSTPDKERIQCTTRNDGDSRATDELFDRLLKRGSEAFPMFVRALRFSGNDHLAMILDPSYQVEQSVEPQCQGQTPFFCPAGPAIDVRTTVRITNDYNKQICHELEETIANKYKLQKSMDCKSFRKEFAKYLPQGATFLHTVSEGSDKSVQFAFRLSKTEAADELWNMFTARKLQKHFRELLMNCITQIKEQTLDVNNIKFEVNYLKDVHTNARKKLEAIESGQVSKNSLENVGDTEMDIPFKNLTISDFISQVFLDNGKGQQAIELDLRNYQKELAKPAIEGQNTIICAPTNSGKTYVALHIARNHLDNMNGKGKVLFLVSTVNLVLQQRERFQLYLNDKYKITEMSSAHTTGEPLEEKVRANDVVVLTAQILVNALRDGRLNLHDISLLIFDECHHTHGDHPYNKTMEVYMTLFLQPARERKLPQIVGMTASLGVGKARHLSDAQNHILSLCANLDSACISTVKEFTSELSEHTSSPQRDVHAVHRNRKTDVFYCVINKVMKTIEEFVGNVVNFELPPTSERESQRYRQWCENLYSHGVLAANRYVVTYADQLREYNIALSINDATRMKDALEKLRKYFNRMREELFTNVDKNLKTLYLTACDALDEAVNKNGEPQNPMLLKIQELLLQLSKDNPDAKGILFSKTRETTLALENWIRENEKLNKVLRPLRLVGSNDSDGAMTQNEQEEVIAKFKLGTECNLIIATTVAEEGLDIADCSYVIRYDMIGNEISSVQSRGRIRTMEGGQYLSVVGADTSGLQKEKLNGYRECLMVESLAHVQEMDSVNYKLEIQKFQKEAAQERALKEKLRESRKSQFDPNDVTLKCRKCHVVACQAHDLRRVKDSYHIVIPDDFDDKIDKIDIPASYVKSFYEVSIAQSIQCKHCGEHWGCMVNLKGLEMPCLKVQHFVLELRKKDRVLKMNPKRWKQCPFDVQPVEIRELLDIKLNDEATFFNRED